MTLALREPLPEPSPARPRLRVLPALPPRTRGDCSAGPRPCPWTKCRYSLLAEPKRPPGGPTCVLDIADGGGATLEQIADLLGITHQAVSQAQARGLRRLAAAEVLR